jgi:hypothetical protein
VPLLVLWIFLSNPVASFQFNQSIGWGKVENLTIPVVYFGSLSLRGPVIA